MLTEANTSKFTHGEHPLCEHCGDYHPRWEYTERIEGGLPRLTCPSCGGEFGYWTNLDIHTALFVKIINSRHGDHAEKMAEALVRHEQGTRELVGLSENCDRALYCNTEAETIVAVEFDKHGVYEPGERIAEVGDAGSWVDVYGGDLSWVHPRYLE
jgi:hypothetical protein